MKRHVQTTGIRFWAGDDLLELQGESLKVIDEFFGHFGPCIISGCKIEGNTIKSGIVGLRGYDHEEEETYKVVPFEETEVDAFPVYLTLNYEVEEREYGDNKVKPVAYEYYAALSPTPPAEGEYFTIYEEGNHLFVDVIQDPDHRFLNDVQVDKLSGIIHEEETYLFFGKDITLKATEGDIQIIANESVVVNCKDLKVAVSDNIEIEAENNITVKAKTGNTEITSGDTTSLTGGKSNVTINEDVKGEAERDINLQARTGEVNVGASEAINLNGKNLNAVADVTIDLQGGSSNITINEVVSVEADKDIIITSQTGNIEVTANDTVSVTSVDASLTLDENATIEAGKNVSLKAKDGTISVTASDNVDLTGNKVTIDAVDSVNVTTQTVNTTASDAVNVKGKTITNTASDSISLNGAASTITINNDITAQADKNISVEAKRGNADLKASNTVTISGETVETTATEALTVKGKTLNTSITDSVSLDATTLNVTLNDSASVQAAKDIDLTASTGDTTITSGNNVSVKGGNSIVTLNENLEAAIEKGMILQAKSGEATIEASDAINLSGKTVNTTASDTVTLQGKTLSANATDSVSLNATTLNAIVSDALTAQATNDISLTASTGNAEITAGKTSSVTGGSSKITVNENIEAEADQDISLEAKNGKIKLKANDSLDMETADFNLTVNNDIHLEAAKNIRLEAKDGTGEFTASDTIVLNGGNSTLTVTDNITAEADKNISLEAKGGTADLKASDAVNLSGKTVNTTATEDITIKANENIDINAKKDISLTGENIYLNGDIVVDGQLLYEGIQLTSNDNIDEFRTPGNYSLPASNLPAGTYPSGYADDHSSVLIIYKETDRVAYQILINSARFYVRSLSESAVNSWTGIANSSDLRAYLPLAGGAMNGIIYMNENRLHLGQTAGTAYLGYEKDTGVVLNGSTSVRDIKVSTYSGGDINLNTVDGKANYNGNEILTVAGGTVTGDLEVEGQLLYEGIQLTPTDNIDEVLTPGNYFISAGNLPAGTYPDGYSEDYSSALIIYKFYKGGVYQLLMNIQKLYMRNLSETAVNGWRRLADDAKFEDYLPLKGGSMSGNIVMNQNYIRLGSSSTGGSYLRLNSNVVELHSSNTAGLTLETSSANGDINLKTINGKANYNGKELAVKEDIPEIALSDQVLTIDAAGLKANLSVEVNGNIIRILGKEDTSGEKILIKEINILQSQVIQNVELRDNILYVTFIIADESEEGGMKYETVEIDLKQYIDVYYSGDYITVGSDNKINLNYEEVHDKLIIDDFLRKDDVVDNVTSINKDLPLSANQGKVLNEKFSEYLPLLGGTITGDLTIDGQLFNNSTRLNSSNNIDELITPGNYYWVSASEVTGTFPEDYITTSTGLSVIQANTTVFYQLLFNQNRLYTRYINTFNNGITKWNKYSTENDLSSYLPLAGGTMTGSINMNHQSLNLAASESNSISYTPEKGIYVKGSSAGITLESSTKDLNINVNNAYYNNSEIATLQDSGLNPNGTVDRKWNLMEGISNVNNKSFVVAFGTVPISPEVNDYIFAKGTLSLSNTAGGGGAQMVEVDIDACNDYNGSIVALNYITRRSFNYKSSSYSLTDSSNEYAPEVSKGVINLLPCIFMYNGTMYYGFRCEGIVQRPHQIEFQGRIVDRPGNSENLTHPIVIPYYDRTENAEQVINQEIYGSLLEGEAASTYLRVNYDEPYLWANGKRVVTKNYLENNYLPLSGGEIVGDLTIEGTVNLNAEAFYQDKEIATKEDVSNSMGINWVVDGTSKRVVEGNNSENQTKNLYYFNFNQTLGEIGLIGKTIKVSFDWEAEGEDISGSFLLQNSPSPYVTIATIHLSEDNKSGHIERTFVLTERIMNCNKIQMRMDDVPVGTFITLSNFRYEKGEVEHDFSISPEDYSSLLELKEKDLIEKSELEENYLPLSGGTMSGSITMSGKQLNLASNSESFLRWNNGRGVELNSVDEYGTTIDSSGGNIEIKASNANSNYSNIRLITNGGSATYNGEEIASRLYVQDNFIRSSEGVLKGDIALDGHNIRFNTLTGTTRIGYNAGDGIYFGSGHSEGMTIETTASGSDIRLLTNNGKALYNGTEIATVDNLPSHPVLASIDFETHYEPGDMLYWRELKEALADGLWKYIVVYYRRNDGTVSPVTVTDITSTSCTLSCEVNGELITYGFATTGGDEVLVTLQRKENIENNFIAEDHSGIVWVNCNYMGDNEDGSIGAPYKTISKAIEDIQTIAEPSTIELKITPGVYEEGEDFELEVINSIHKLIFSAVESGVSGANVRIPLLLIENSDVSLKGIHFEEGIYIEGGNVHIGNCYVRGIGVTQTENLYMEHCSIGILIMYEAKVELDSCFVKDPVLEVEYSEEELMGVVIQAGELTLRNCTNMRLGHFGGIVRSFNTWYYPIVVSDLPIPMGVYSDASKSDTNGIYLYGGGVQLWPEEFYAPAEPGFLVIHGGCEYLLTDFISNKVKTFINTGEEIESGLGGDQVIVTNSGTNYERDNNKLTSHLEGINTALGSIKSDVVTVKEDLEERIDNLSVEDNSAVIWVNGTYNGEKEDGSMSAPYKTITKAIQKASLTSEPAKEIRIRPGDYSENIELDNINNSLIITAYKGGSGLQSEVSVNNLHISTSSGTVSIIGIEFKSWAMVYGANTIKFQDCIFNQDLDISGEIKGYFKNCSIKYFNINIADITLDSCFIDNPNIYDTKRIGIVSGKLTLNRCHGIRLIHSGGIVTSRDTWFYPAASSSGSDPIAINSTAAKSSSNAIFLYGGGIEHWPEEFYNQQTGFLYIASCKYSLVNFVYDIPPGAPMSTEEVEAGLGGNQVLIRDIYSGYTKTGNKLTSHLQGIGQELVSLKSSVNQLSRNNSNRATTYGLLNEGRQSVQLEDSPISVQMYLQNDEINFEIHSSNNNPKCLFIHNNEHDYEDSHVTWTGSIEMNTFWNTRLYGYHKVEVELFDYFSGSYYLIKGIYIPNIGNHCYLYLEKLI